MTLVNDKAQPVERRRGGVDLQGRGETYSVGEGAFTIRDSDARRDERLVTPTSCLIFHCHSERSESRGWLREAGYLAAAQAPA